jgi:hypothetical protein
MAISIRPRPTLPVIAALLIAPAIARGEPPDPVAVEVHVTSTAPGEALTRYDLLGSGGRQGIRDTKRICPLPCTTVLPDDGTSYHVTGPGLVPSPIFTLPPGTPEVTVRVRPAPLAPFITGVFLSTLGMTFTPLGATFVATGAGEEPSRSPGSGAFIGAGATFAALGVVSLAVGLPLWLSNRSKVSLERTTGAVTPGAIPF